MRLVLVVLMVWVTRLESQEPREVASAALRAWHNRDVRALDAIVHPELRVRLPTAEAIRSYLQARESTESPLQAIARGRSAEPDDVPAFSSLPLLPSLQILELLCKALDERDPRSRRLFYDDRWTETIIVGDIAMVHFSSITKLRSDSAINRRSSKEVFLKKDRADWRFLWSPAVMMFVDPTWDPRSELVDVKLISDGRTSVSIVDVSFVGHRFSPLFSRLTLKLPPGTYEVIGSRKGYRDEHWLAQVSRDARANEIVAICSVPSQ